jgi:hypothetical protein
LSRKAVKPRADNRESTVHKFPLTILVQLCLENGGNFSLNHRYTTNTTVLILGVIRQKNSVWLSMLVDRIFKIRVEHFCDSYSQKRDTSLGWCVPDRLKFEHKYEIDSLIKLQTPNTVTLNLNLGTFVEEGVKCRELEKLQQKQGGIFEISGHFV